MRYWWLYTSDPGDPGMEMITPMLHLQVWKHFSNSRQWCNSGTEWSYFPREFYFHSSVWPNSGFFTCLLLHTTTAYNLLTCRYSKVTVEEKLFHRNFSYFKLVPHEFFLFCLIPNSLSRTRENDKLINCGLIVLTDTRVSTNTIRSPAAVLFISLIYNTSTNSGTNAVGPKLSTRFS